MTYRVKLVPLPIVVDPDGTPVAEARVLEISFPGETIATRLGKVNAISGAGIARIIVAGKIIRGVALC